VETKRFSFFSTPTTVHSALKIKMLAIKAPCPALASTTLLQHPNYHITQAHCNKCNPFAHYHNISERQRFSAPRMTIFHIRTKSKSYGLIFSKWM
jgi:hypothetical protein